MTFLKVGVSIYIYMGKIDKRILIKLIPKSMRPECENILINKQQKNCRTNRFRNY